MELLERLARKEDRAGEDAGVLKWKGKKVKGCR